MGPDGLGEATGWVEVLLRVIVLLAKVMAVILFFMFARWTWPRFRFDQLMELAWKVMLPCGLVNFVVVAAWMEFDDEASWLLGLPDAVEPGGGRLAGAAGFLAGDCDIRSNRETLPTTAQRFQTSMKPDDQKIAWIESAAIGAFWADRICCCSCKG